ncbi:MAG: hypothetical protein CVU64_22285 [Deltaproteobacteria bacterium HGW-Deltaproteobacteria-21]|nr:MAG: hypothetical protein CVU64_22285 [Deltaproteobacteria bacterium HGW-Deltaproteobacteria-21]
MASGAALLRNHPLSFAGILAGVILGLIFLVAGFGKLPAQTDAYTILLVIRKEPVLLWLSDYVHIIVPSLELFMGFLLVSGVAARLTALASAALTGVFIFNNLWVIRHGVSQDSCGCFGDALDRLLGGISTMEALYVDFAMLALVFLVSAFYPDKWFSLRPWFLRGRPS